MRQCRHPPWASRAASCSGSRNRPSDASRSVYGIEIAPGMWPARREWVSAPVYWAVERASTTWTSAAWRVAHSVDVDQAVDRRHAQWGRGRVGVALAGFEWESGGDPGGQAAVEDMGGVVSDASKYPRDPSRERVSVVVIGDHHRVGSDSEPRCIGLEHGWPRQRHGHVGVAVGEVCAPVGEHRARGCGPRGSARRRRGSGARRLPPRRARPAPAPGRGGHAATRTLPADPIPSPDATGRSAPRCRPPGDGWRAAARRQSRFDSRAIPWSTRPTLTADWAPRQA